MKIVVNIPEGVKIDIAGSEITVSGEKGTTKRNFPENQIQIKKEGNTVVLSADKDVRKLRAVLGAFEAHIKNMIKGVREGVTYKMKMVYSHFPMTLKVQGNEMIISNFLGERYVRKAKIYPNVKIDVKEQNLTLMGCDKEGVGQTAASIEQATKIRKRDPRVFQDGIYIIEKDGKKIV